MHSRLNKRYWLVVFVVILILQDRSIQAQESKERSFNVVGNVDNNMKPLTNVKVSLIKNGNVEKTYITSTDGKFHFTLELNSEYTILVEKSGMLPKKIYFNTKVPDDAFNKWTNEFGMSLYAGCEGVNTSILDEPVDRIQFSTNSRDFVSDKAYADNIHNRLAKLQTDIENCQENKFQSKINEGDKLFNAKQYDQARDKYQDALKMFPEDAYAQKKIDEINKKIGQNQQTQQRYDALIKDADLLMVSKNYAEAKEKYQQAQALMPDNAYPGQKITEADNLLKNQSQADQSKSEAEKNYNNLIAKANTAYSLQNYEEAKNAYQQALLIKPNSTLPQQKIKELDPLIAQQKQKNLEKSANDKSYNEALAQAQTALLANNLVAARQYYNQALQLKPDAALPKQKMDEIDKQTMQKQAANQKAQKNESSQKINQALDEGDQYFNQKNYDAAEVAYLKVLDIDPKDEYAKQRLDKIKNLKLAAQAEKQKNLEKSFTENVSKADELVKTASYQQAVEVYKQALLLKPDDIALKTKISETEKKMAADQQKQTADLDKKKQYDQKINLGNTAFASKQYTQAKDAFQGASVLYPDQAYPRSKIAEIDKILADQQNLLQYNTIITQADQLFTAKKLSEAKSSYQQALSIKPGEAYPSGQISKIDALIAEQIKNDNAAKAKEQQYNTAITQADQLFQAKKLQEAKSAYQQALLIKPGEVYPTGQISRIDALIAEQIKNENDAKAKEQQYAAAITKGDQLFAAKKFAEAKTSYQQASILKPGDIYPTGQITKIDALIAEQIKNDNAAKAKEQQYNNAIVQADQLFTAKKYSEAKSGYQQALTIKPGEVYPTGQVTKIDALVAEQIKNENAAKAKEQQYNTAITQADQLFAAKKYSEAKSGYQQAITIKPGEVYPAGQITKIDALVADQIKKDNDAKAKEQQYNAAITQADQLLAAKKLTDAKAAYQQALLIKPNEKYPSDQIAKVDLQLSAIAKQNQESAATDQKYNSFIAAADKAYDTKDFVTAKANYNQALGIKPAETYPKERLNKISEYEKMIAQEEAARKVSKTTTTGAEKSKSAVEPLADLKFANESERQKYLDGLRSKYPVGVTLEVHNEKNRVINRFVIIRDGEVREFRKVVYSWGGTEFSLNGIACTGLYFDTQVKVREGEFYKEVDY
jgi:tetratricopeptide (TPR) repeat protein